MKRTWKTPIAGLLTFAACSGSAVAYACTYSPVTFQAASGIVPVNGPIVIEILCQETDFCLRESIDGVAVSGASGRVPGTFEMQRGGERSAFLVFRPSVSLQAGESYAVRISEQTLLHDYGPDGPQPLEVRADDAFRWVTALEPSWQLTTVSEDTGERFCCFAAQACFDHCFTEARAVKVALAPALPGGADGAGLAYALRWTETDGSVKRQDLQPWIRWINDTPTHFYLRAVFEQPADRYCATLEVRNLDSGETRELSHCESADTTVAVGTRLSPLHDEEMLRDCQVPPGMDFACDPTVGPCEQKSEALRQAWCEANEAPCAGGAMGGWVGLCEKHAALCAGAARAAVAEPSSDATVSEQSCRVDATRPLGALASYGLPALLALVWRRRTKRA